MRENFEDCYPESHELPLVDIVLTEKKIILANSLTEITINFNQMLHTEIMNIEVEFMRWYQEDIVSKEEREKCEEILRVAFDAFRKRVETEICYPMYSYLNK